MRFSFLRGVSACHRALREAAGVALLVIVAMATGLGIRPAAAQCVSLSMAGSAVTQNFDTLANTAGSTTNGLALSGWYLSEAGGGARDNEQYGVDAGSSNIGDTYSYGSAGSTERALGGLRSGTLIPTFGACFTNNTGETIAALDIAYTGEQWRLGTAARTDHLDFEYSTSASSLTSGTWTGVGELRFVTPVTTPIGAKDGNLASNRTTLATTISTLNIPNGSSVWIRWVDIDASGADDGLAIDDFSLTPLALPVISINDVTASEGNTGTTVLRFTVSLSSPALSGGVSFDINTADSTATAGTDYVARSLTTQTIPEGESSYTFDVIVNGDTVVELDETFFVNLANLTGATAGDTQGQGTILNDDVAPVVPGTLRFKATTYSVGESGGTATITVERIGGSDGSVSVDYATADGSATAGTDYVAASGTLTWAHGDTTDKSFTVSITDDTVVEADETVTLSLSHTTGGASLGTASATLTILNDDVAPVVPGTLRFKATTYSVGENGGTATITVERIGGSDGSVSVDYATADGSATAGTDYVAASGTLTWAHGDTTDKSFTVSITDDTVVEADETVTLSLSHTTGGASLGTASATLTILNDDVAPVVPGTLRFKATTYSVGENGGTATITVERIGGSDGSVSVDYATADGSATAGTDYVAASGTLTWAHGDTTDKSFTVSITDDTVVEADETVTLSLSHTTGGASLGTASATLTILNDDAPPPAVTTAVPSLSEWQLLLLSLLVGLFALAYKRRAD